MEFDDTDRISKHIVFYTDDDRPAAVCRVLPGRGREMLYCRADRSFKGIPQAAITDSLSSAKRSVRAGREGALETQSGGTGTGCRIL